MCNPCEFKVLEFSDPQDFKKEQTKMHLHKDTVPLSQAEAMIPSPEPQSSQRIPSGFQILKIPLVTRPPTQRDPETEKLNLT